MSRDERQLDPRRSALHRFGYELRACRKGRGLSQDALGKSVHVSGDLVRLIEIGDRRPTRDFAARCDSVLDTLGAFLRLWDDVEAERVAGADTVGNTDNLSVGTDSRASYVPTQQADETIPVEMLSLTGEQISVPINRRSLVFGLAAVPAAAFLGGIAPQVAEGDLADVIQNLTQMRSLLAAQDNIFGPGVVLPTAVNHVSILKQLSRSATGHSRDSLMSLQSAYGEFCGWLADDIGDKKTGQFWIDRSLEWAHESDDDVVVGYILMRKAQRAADAGDPASAIGLARAALRHGALPARVVAATRQYEAQGHALEKNTAAFRGAIDNARQTLADAPALRDGDWAIWCTPAYVDIHEASGYMRLGDPGQAIAKYESALSGWSGDFQRDQGIYRSRLGNAYAAARQPEPAAETGRLALSIAQRTGSSRILAELLPLAGALDEWRSVPVVRDFLAELRGQLTARATIPGMTPSIEMGRQ